MTIPLLHSWSLGEEPCWLEVSSPCRRIFNSVDLGCFHPNSLALQCRPRGCWPTSGPGNRNRHGYYLRGVLISHQEWKQKIKKLINPRYGILKVGCCLYQERGSAGKYISTNQNWIYNRSELVLKKQYTNLGPSSTADHLQTKRLSIRRTLYSPKIKSLLSETFWLYFYQLNNMQMLYWQRRSRRLNLN